MRIPQVAFSLVAGLVLLGVSGCRSSWDVPLDETFYTKEVLEDMSEIRLPDNYSPKHFKHLKVAVNVKVEDANGHSLISPAFSRRLQALFDKVKRFEVHALHGTSVVEMSQLADLDETVKLPDATEVRDIDLLLDGVIRISKTVNDELYSTEHVYVADGDFQCTDLKTRTLLFSETKRDRWGYTIFKRHEKRNGNANIGSEEVAMQNACLRCLRKFVNTFGNRFPVGGRVTGITGSGDTMVMAAGVHEGVLPNQQVCVFLSEDGLDIPVAFAEATPRADGTSQLRVYRWNTDNADAKSVVKEIRGSARSFLKQYKGDAKNGLYAVGFGMPIPADWERQKK